MKTITLTLALTFATMALTCAAFAADEKPEVSKKPSFVGTFVAKEDLPQVVKEQSAKKQAKHPSFPGCQKGRIVTTWETVLAEFPDVDKTKHACSDAKEIYACQAFSRASVRCMEGGK
jgi:hypothetical protein